MKKLIKILAAILFAVLLVTAGLSVFVHFYLTDNRVKKLVIPRLENALARDVKLKDIQVSLLKGVSLKDFVILEADGQDEFVKVESFNLRYDLLPLLNKQLKISRIVLNDPRIKVVRNDDGKFNYETLKPLLSEKEEKIAEPESPSKSGEAVLPLALTISSIKINDAELTFKDDLEEIPAVRALVDGSVSMETGQDLASLQYSGRLDLKAETIHEVTGTVLEGGTTFDRNQAIFDFDLQIEDQKVDLSGIVKEYLEKPDIVCDAESSALNLDYLLAAFGAVGEKDNGEGEEKVTNRESLEKTTSNGAESGKQTGEKLGQPIGKGLPEGLKARGEVRIAKAKYQDLVINDFKLDYLVQDNILRLDDISAHTAEGRVVSRLTVDLNQLEPEYDATLVIQEVEMAPLQSSLFPKAGQRISGDMTANLQISGKGFQWPDLADSLNGEGTYEIRRGRIYQLEILSAIADLLQEKSLKDITFEDFEGDFQIKEGDIMLESSLDGNSLDLRSEGVVGLDGKLAMPLILKLSPELSEKLDSGTAISDFLLQEDGATTLNLYLTGSVSDPKVSLDTAAAREKIEKNLTDTIREKAGEKLEEIFGRDKAEEEKSEKKASPEEVVNDFINDILGN